MGYNLKTFEEFINENSVYHNSEPILETDGAAVMKKWNSIPINTIKDVQTFLKEYGTKVVDGKGKTNPIKITGILDDQTVTAFWNFQYGGKDMLVGSNKNPQPKTVNQLAAKISVNTWEKTLTGLIKRVYYMVKQKNGVSPIPPFSVPKDVLGSRDYYKYRANDFEIRDTKQNKIAPDYYMSYGDRYARAFKDKTRPKMSEKGKIWLDKTLVSLQDTIEKKIKSDNKIELDSLRFRKFAFDSHPDCYVKSGLFNLGAPDLYQIAMTPEWRDLLTQEAMVQILEIIKKWSSQKAEQIAKLPFKIWNASKGAFNSTVNTVAKELEYYYDILADAGKTISKSATDFYNWLTECEEQARLEGYPGLYS